MAKAPQKTCPNLFRLLEDAEGALIQSFLNASAFERLGWINSYKLDSNDPGAPVAAREMLRREKKERLSPLETEAARIITIAGSRGQFALDGLARTKLHSVRATTLLGQRDELARSLWAYINEDSLFEAAENTLHLRLYRRYDKHYQTFKAEPSKVGEEKAGTDLLNVLLADLSDRLDRGDGYNIERFDIPENADEPASEMYLLFHPNPPTSVREIDDAGKRSRMYFRPPGEAMVVYTPSTGRLHVRAGTRSLRHTIAESFIESVLEQPVSSQPVDFQAYDLSRFFEGFDLATPDVEDAVILRAQVIRADVSIGSVANRLSITTTIDQDITSIIDSQPGLGKTFQRAVAIRFVEIAVQYRRTGSDNLQTLDFTLTDRNTSSLLSLDDHFERVLGHRLLRHWGIFREGRMPDATDSLTAIPALLELWDIGVDRVSGAWLESRGIDATLLTDLGFLVPASWEGDDLIDDEDSLGLTAIEVIQGTKGSHLKVAEGQLSPSVSSETYRAYRVRAGWVAEHLRERVSNFLDEPAIEEINANILALGAFVIDARKVPTYLARGLHDGRIRAAVDTELRARHDLGIGLVLQAGKASGSCLAANVLTPIIEHVETDACEIILSADKLRTVFLRNRALARGGQTVQLHRIGEGVGTLFVPGKGSIDISGANRLLVIERLVGAHNSGPAPMATGDLTKGIEDQSLANIFKQPLWDKLKADFVRPARKGLWEIAI